MISTLWYIKNDLTFQMYRSYFDRRIFLSIFICLPACFHKPNTQIQIYKMWNISIPQIYSEKLRKDIVKQINAEDKTFPHSSQFHITSFPNKAIFWVTYNSTLLLKTQLATHQKFDFYAPFQKYFCLFRNISRALSAGHLFPVNFDIWTIFILMIWSS